MEPACCVHALLLAAGHAVVYDAPLGEAGAEVWALQLLHHLCEVCIFPASCPDGRFDFHALPARLLVVRLCTLQWLQREERLRRQPLRRARHDDAVQQRAVDLGLLHGHVGQPLLCHPLQCPGMDFLGEDEARQLVSRGPPGELRCPDPWDLGHRRRGRLRGLAQGPGRGELEGAAPLESGLRPGRSAEQRQVAPLRPPAHPGRYVGVDWRRASDLQRRALSGNNRQHELLAQSGAGMHPQAGHCNLEGKRGAEGLRA
mmetsp:Transcript_105689/g.315690  ORF Transcript_105689/g.315690 Transcript_105689/m.315690 type:complete len:258 (+) Transcript_105689:887-1660(+)